MSALQHKTAMKPSPPAKGSPQDKSWEGYHPRHTSKCALLCETAHMVEWTPNDVRAQACPQWYQNNFNGNIHISHPQKDKWSCKFTSCPCSGLHLIILYKKTLFKVINHLTRNVTLLHIQLLKQKPCKKTLFDF